MARKSQFALPPHPQTIFCDMMTLICPESEEGAGIMPHPKYSIVIPAFNESGRIPATLDAVIACIRDNAWDAEIIVVNDGSTDNTAEIVRNIAADAPELRMIENPGNRGKGYAVRNGVLHALGDIVMFTDSDLSAPIVE